MRLTIVKDDSTVSVDGEGAKVDLSGLPADFHALQWSGAQGEVEYAPRVVDKELHKRPNEFIFDLSPYQKYVDAWHAARSKS